MDAISSGARALNLSASEVGGDPLQLVLQGIYSKRGSFYAPFQAWKR